MSNVYSMVKFNKYGLFALQNDYSRQKCQINIILMILVVLNRPKGSFSAMIGGSFNLSPGGGVSFAEYFCLKVEKCIIYHV